MAPVTPPVSATGDRAVALAAEPVLPSSASTPVPHATEAGTQVEYGYSMYGLAVWSAVPLPLAARALDGEPDVVFRLAPEGATPPEPDGPVVATEPCPVHTYDVVAYRGPQGAVVTIRDAGTFHVTPDARVVTIYPAPDADPRVIGLVLAGQISVFVQHQRGRPTLHASAIATTTPGSGSSAAAIAFCGPSGQGKSTLAACFLRRGASLLTDDVLPLQVDADAIRALPSLPYMKVWPGTATGALRLDQDLPALLSRVDAHDKRLFRLEDHGGFTFATQAVPLRAVYLIQRYDPAERGTTEIQIEPLTARTGVAALLAQVSRGAYLLPAEAGRFLPVYARLVAQAPVRVLRFPNGFEHHDALYARVLADVAGGSGRPSPRPNPSARSGVAG